MSNRDTGFLALRRFLAVERYCQSSQPPSTHPARNSRPDWTAGQASTPDPRFGSRAPARPRHG
jgi:hypothetical protein